MKRLGIFIGMVASFGLVACEDSKEPSTSVGYEEKDLYEHGPYTVGMRKTTMTYDAPGEDEPRPLPIVIWYPGEAQEGAKRSKLTLASIYSIPRLQSYNNLPLADLGTLPVAVYSHGSGGEASLAYEFGEYFASRGWVLIAPSHTDNTTLDRIGSGSRGLVELSPVRPMDLQAVLDEAETGFGFEDFAGRFDVANTFLFGHSFGGFTSLALGGADFDYDFAKNHACQDEESSACQFLSDPEVIAASEGGFRDARVRAIGLQAPAPIGILDSAGVEVPTLMLSGNRDLTTPDATSAEPIWEGLSDPSDLWVRFPQAGHYSFITICSIIDPDIISSIVPGAKEDGCGEGFTPPADVVRLNTAYLLSFAEKHVLGVESWDGYLTGDARLQLEAEVDADLELLTHAR